MGSWAPRACVSAGRLWGSSRAAEVISAVRRNRRLCCDGQIRKQKHHFCCSVSCEKFPDKPQQKPLINHCSSDEDWLIDRGDFMELTCLSGTINYRKCSSIQTATFSLQFSNLRHCSQNYSARQNRALNIYESRKALRAADRKMPVYPSFWRTWKQGVALHRRPVISEVQHQHRSSLWRKCTTEFRSARDGAVSGDTQQRRI